MRHGVGQALGVTARARRTSRPAWMAPSVARRGLLAGFALLGACGLVATSMSSAAAAGTGVLSPWAVESENPNPSQKPVAVATAVKDAHDFNLIIAHPVDYQGDVAQMRAANPRLVLLAYENATFAQKAQGAGLPESAFSHDKNGNRIKNPATGDLLMDPSNQAWITTRMFECKSFVASTGYDGCYLDLLGLAPLKTPFVSGVAINVATGQPWTPAQWLQATGWLAGAVRAAVHPAVLYGNGLSNGSLFWDSNTKQLVVNLDGGIAEAWIRGSHDPESAFPTAALWKQNVDMLAYVEGQGKPLLTLTKLWVKASPAQVAQWMQYTLASFLLGTQGLSEFFFSSGQTVSRTTPCAWCSLNLGAPLGQYGPVGAAFGRTFTNGRVFVNPTRATVKLSLGGKYYTVTRQAVSTVVLAPNSGLVLTKS